MRRSSFYRRYGNYERDGLDGFGTKADHTRLTVIGHAIPCVPKLCPLVLRLARFISRELASPITDAYNDFVSKSSAYHLLKAHDLTPRPSVW